ncbi:uncharacterized protein K452DRAFT_249209 [Aplosporella prunicola CBS 121167]|uniref:Ribosomal protein S15 n=1 Tax=Aplosporella prunicola CBS 121167 TaxID=1176127 RepID=A0A6A6BE82_9PEZI|nr:uncharacterized protein K452DRAFT_249209 [Aplosporella prunicola CBS 121167]KAF2142482.1 hypothetical protein K452DRAFT_249209 [Aplosporella prunicola CBS 121167]
MPPRISLPVRLRAPTAPQCSPASAIRAFSTTPANNAKNKQANMSLAARRKLHDPYLRAQARARKAANLSRRAVLQEERAHLLGDPVRGIPTPFVQSFDTQLPQTPKVTDAKISSTTTTDPSQTPEGPDATSERFLNHYLSPQEIKESLAISNKLTTPAEQGEISEQLRLQNEAFSKSPETIALEQSNAATAIQRIVSLANANSKDKTRANIQRCIDMFGRHKTDLIFPPRPTAQTTQHAPPPVPVEGSVVGADGTAPLNPEALTRAGPDTGSSEVQIGILTVKIKALADYLQLRGKKDKVNKRNLRLLVHRRQKLLRYVQKKERGGPRWQHLVETLGLTDGTWKGEISL